MDVIRRVCKVGLDSGEGVTYKHSDKGCLTARCLVKLIGGVLNSPTFRQPRGHILDCLVT